MNTHDYQQLNDLESTYWWHVGKLDLVTSLIEQIVLQNPSATEKPNLQIADVGCGTGLLMKHLQTYGEITGIDSSEVALSFCRTKGFSDLIKSDVTNLPEKLHNTFDLITALDVIEHIQDDLLALKQMQTILKPNGYAIITVPAHKFLWSEHDEALHHYRRYSKNEFFTKIKTSGFSVLKLTYFISSLFFPIFAYRTFRSVFIKSAFPKTSYVLLPSAINNTLINLLKLEAYLIRYTNLPIGVSLVCVCQKAGS